MMYTFGDVKNSLAETAEVIEDILHGQLVDIVLRKEREIVYFIITPFRF